MKIESELYSEITEQTKKDYSPIVEKEPENPVLVTSNNIEKMLEDLLKVIEYKNAIIEEQEYKIEHLEDKIKDIEKDIEDNFKRIPISQQVRC